MPKTLGLYIHIPFCKQKCNYCDFYSLGCQENNIPSYIEALCTHIKREAPLYKDYQIDTVFIGGGTPSLVSEKNFTYLVDTLKNSFIFTQSAEFSIEANPGTLTKEKLNCYKQNGVNRLSIGLQSVSNTELKALGRIHSYDEFLNSYNLARECGFDNINIDVMYGLPNQALDSLKDTLSKVCSLYPEHISAYCLKIEDGTPFYKIQDTLKLPSDDEEYEMYMYLCNELAKHGYEQYEISNFSKKDRRCVHNLKYWLSQEYIGFGPSAHSFFNGERYYYLDSIQNYLNDIKISQSVDNLPKKHYEEQSDLPICSADEYLMLKMRLSDGVSEAEFKSKFGTSLLDNYPEIQDYLKDGYIEHKNGAYSFTPKGFFVSNYILAKILKFNI